MIRPLRDWVCLKVLPYEHEFLFVTGITIRKGEIIAVGPGRRMRRLIPYRRNPDRTDEVTWFADGPETGVIRPMRVKLGQIVEFGWRAGCEFELEGEKLIMVPEQSCYWETSRTGGLMEAESMRATA